MSRKIEFKTSVAVALSGLDVSAKRLHERLSKLIEEYESRHGVLE